MAAGPLVSIVIPAFNLARFLPAAIDSALAQHDPGGPTEIIVVDDGSTDGTPEVLASYADRVRVIRQANAGFVTTVERALAQVSGTYVALLDADDEWPPDRLARHVAILQARPEVGLVHGDMEVMDAEGGLLHASFFDWQGLRPVNGRAVGPLLSNNFVSGGASTFRRDLLPAILPFGPEVAYPDWRIAVGIAAVAEIVYDPASANRYRSHGANMGLDAGPARRAALLRAELPWRRWMMRELSADPTVTPAHLVGALAAWRHALTTAALGADVPVRMLLEPLSRAADAPALGARGADAAGAGAPATGAPGTGARALMRAFAADPFDGALAVELEIALMREAALPAPAAPPAAATLSARPRLALARLPDVLAAPELMEAFAAETVDGELDSLAILAAPDADLAPLVALVESSPALSDERCDIQVIAEPSTAPARAWLCARASSRLSTGDGDPGDPYGSLPAHSALERVAALS